MLRFSGNQGIWQVLVSKFDFKFLFNYSGVYVEHREYLLLMSRLTTKMNVLLYLKIIYFFSVLLVIHVTLFKFSLKFLTSINISFQFFDLNLYFSKKAENTVDFVLI